LSIQFKCECGAPLTADESQIGRLIHCDACDLDVPVPGPDAPPEAAADPFAPHGQATEDMIHQVDEAQGTDHEALAARHREDLGELQNEIDGREAAAQEAERKKAGLSALHDQLGQRGGHAEMAAQLAGAARPEGAPASVGRDELGPRKVRSVSRKPPTGHARASHHIGFKRAMWMPSLVIGLLCLGLGAYCFLPGGENPYARSLARFNEDLKAAGIAEFEVVKTRAGKPWAVAKGSEHRETNMSEIFFVNRAGYEDKGVPADAYVQAQTFSSGEQSRYLGFGVGLVVVGLALAGLSLWMHHDVKLVARQAAPADDGAAEKPRAKSGVGALAAPVALAATASVQPTAAGPGTPGAAVMAVPTLEAAPPSEAEAVALRAADEAEAEHEADEIREEIAHDECGHPHPRADVDEADEPRA
jgi:hypothetical protein